MHPPAMTAAAKLTLEQVEVHYKNADVPMVKPSANCCRVIINMYKKYMNEIRRISADRRQKSLALQKVADFSKELDRTMRLWPKNVRAIISSISHPRERRERNIQEDHKFFDSMLTDRSATYGAADGLTRSLSKKRENRKRKLENYYHRELFSNQNDGNVVDGDSPDDLIDDQMNNEQDAPCSTSSFVPPASVSSKKNVLTPVLAKDFFKHPKIVEAATRLNISPTAKYIMYSTILQVSFYLFNLLFS